MGSDRLLTTVANVDHASRHGLEIQETKRQFFARVLPSLTPTRGARDLLQRLTEIGMRLVTATSAGDDERLALLRAAGVNHLIEVDCRRKKSRTRNRPPT
jgi:phosphoglycolate phosphatase-like HAD superfamily hydrolase